MPQTHTHRLLNILKLQSSVSTCLPIYKSLSMECTVMMKLLKFDIITPITVVLHYIMRRRYYMSSLETLEN